MDEVIRHLIGAEWIALLATLVLGSIACLVIVFDENENLTLGLALKIYGYLGLFLVTVTTIIVCSIPLIQWSFSG